ncbi:hypothetical protein BHE74_00047642 [Ensete ventricosum]|nr:hypothetical protein BHE74_00047642 [Ensete ventricosum]
MWEDAELMGGLEEEGRQKGLNPTGVGNSVEMVLGHLRTASNAKNRRRGHQRNRGKWTNARPNREGAKEPT